MDASQPGRPRQFHARRGDASALAMLHSGIVLAARVRRRPLRGTRAALMLALYFFSFFHPVNPPRFVLREFDRNKVRLAIRAGGGVMRSRIAGRPEVVGMSETRDERHCGSVDDDHRRAATISQNSAASSKRYRCKSRASGGHRRRSSRRDIDRHAASERLCAFSDRNKTMP